jgi:NAD(P)-dependent dehydrogenase (short-subunit alcohol dehydrogenase family)
VTGAGRGIGAGIAEHLGGLGMKVAACDLSGAKYACDITKGRSVECLFDDVERELGPVWLLVNNAGVYHSGPTESLDEDAWDLDFAVDVKGTFLCCQSAIRRMMPRRGGRIVNVASIAGLIVRTKQLSYCSAKAAAIHLSRCLAVEMAPHGITVNCLCPGMTDTEMLMQSITARGASLSDYESLVPSGRLARPEDHAGLIAYFASDEASHVTGQVVCVDGGQSQNLPLIR